MARMIKLFIFIIVITQLFMVSGCVVHFPNVHDAPGKAGDRKFLDQLIGQSRETVFAELGRPDLKITQNERQFLMYINIVDLTLVGVAVIFPHWMTAEDSAAACLRIELESNSLVKGVRIKNTARGTKPIVARWIYPSYIRDCLRSFWSEKQLQQTQTQVDEYLELMIVDPISAARMLCENADDGYPLARYMLGEIYYYAMNYFPAYVWLSLSGRSPYHAEERGRIYGLDAKELDNAIKEWQPGQCEPEKLSKIITYNHEKFFGNRKYNFSENWKHAVWRSDSLRSDKETTNIYAPAITTEPVNFTGDFSGTYISTITGDTSDLYIRASNPIVILEQNDNNITGTFGNSGGKIYGVVEGNTIEFYWYSRISEMGNGIWTFTRGQSKVVGTWGFKRATGNTWNLTKIK
jgi:hypothetical protein